jgi:hypothetical protein
MYTKSIINVTFMNDQRISVIVDPPLKQVMTRRAKQMGYGTISAYVRRLVVEDIQRSSDYFLRYPLDEQTLDDGKLNNAFKQSAKAMKKQKFTSPKPLIDSLDN